MQITNSKKWNSDTSSYYSKSGLIHRKNILSQDRKKSGIRKKDYVAEIAIGLFVFIIIFEILLVTWLPSKLITRQLWDKDVALQELIHLHDKLRSNIGRSMKFDNKWQEGEAKMAMSCLNELAKYLRKHQGDMTREQIGEVYSVLQQFEMRYNRWQNKKYCITFETIDIQPLLNQALAKYNNDNKTDKQPEIKKNNILFQD